MRAIPFLRLPLVAALALFPAACEDDPTSAELRRPAVIRLVSGDGQTNAVGQPLPGPLVVRVMNRRGKPVTGRAVAFTASGGGSVATGRARTDADGFARTAWTLGTSTADSQRVVATVMIDRTGHTLSVAFHADPRPEAPSRGMAVSDSVCSGTARMPLADSLAVRIIDRYGNPVPFAEVTWTVMSGGGTISPGAGTTGDDGVVRALWTLGAGAGTPQRVQASVPGVPPVTFWAITASTGPPGLEKVSGDRQTAPWSATIVQSLVVRLRRSDGTPAAYEAIQWTADGGSFVVQDNWPGPSVTDAEGFARGIWRLADDGGPVFQAWATTTAGERVTFTATAFAMPFRFSDLDAGDTHACALGTDRTTYCWGRNDYGQLGVGDTRDRASPAPLAGGLGLYALAAGVSHTCGLLGGRAYCWGSNSEGQLGTGSTGGFSTVPVAVATQLTFHVLTAGERHTCGITYDLASGRAPRGEVYCWGRNDEGQLGDGTTTDRAAPTRIAPVPEDSLFEEVSAGARHTCGTLYRDPFSHASGGLFRVYCWGSNDSGQLRSAAAYSDTPVLVLHSTDIYRFPRNVSSGARHACAMWWHSGGLECWGADGAGQLGSGPLLASPGVSWHGLSSGGEHTCGIRLTPYCWGSNASGQLGRPAAGGSSPVEVLGNLGIVYLIDAGGAFTCARSAIGHPANPGYAYCWGDNTYGQLGNGTHDGGPTPVLVR